MEELKEIEARKQKIQELKEACKPVIEFLKKKHPYCSVTVDGDYIKLNETVIGVSLFVPSTSMDGVIDYCESNPIPSGEACP